MTTHVPLLIDAVVADTERPALAAVAEQLRECLRAAAGDDWPVTVRFRASLAAVDAQDPPAIVVASLLPEVAETGEALAMTQARWHERIAALPGNPRLPVLLCTVFRHVAEPGPAASDARPATRERIRRLNMMAIDLSHDTGAGVVDIDRAFAHVGARPLGTDHRLAGRAAAEVAAHTIVAGILAAGLDDVVPPELQERAAQFQGALRDIERLLARRLTPSP